MRMVRTGDRSAAVPAYNGSLFAADGFPGSDLLERAEITDVYLAPALARPSPTRRTNRTLLDWTTPACKSATWEQSMRPYSL